MYFAYNYTMSLYVIKYLHLLIIEGEMTSRELTHRVGGAIYNASHAMNMLHALGLVKHPQGRIRYWKVDATKPLVLTMEKLLLVSKNNPEIVTFLGLPSCIHIGALIYRGNNHATILGIMKSTGLSRMSVMNGLEKMVGLKLLRKKRGNPNLYYPYGTAVAKLFFSTCSEIENLFSYTKKKKITPKDIIIQIKNDESVLILVHYGSSSRGKADRLSDIDLFVVTRDKYSRGEIISQYSQGGIDLSVYSKKGFLQIIRTQPDFIANITSARILKGKDILEAVVK
jgi:DNA-binding transcriptional regulator GbsR (MarR family)